MREGIRFQKNSESPKPSNPKSPKTLKTYQNAVNGVVGFGVVRSVWVSYHRRLVKRLLKLRTGFRVDGLIAWGLG